MTAAAEDLKFIDEIGISGVFTSEAQALRDKSYSVQITSTGIGTYNLRLETSLNKEDWIIVNNPVDSQLIGLDETDGPVLYDQALGKHRFVRVIIEVTTGSMDFKGWVNS